jgi:hypothetical protein
MYRTHLLLLSLFTVLLGILPAAGFAEDSPGMEVDLSFTPKAGGRYVVEYESTETWDLPAHKMKGKLETRLVLDWEVLRAPAEDKGLAQAKMQSVSYKGSGMKNGKEFRHDIVWTREGGYASGEGTDADRRWARREIGQGVRLTFDRRGAADPGGS